MNWEELLEFLQNHVPAGTETTYGNLSTVFYGASNSAPAIVSMLNGAVNADPRNRSWTNRVVSNKGQLNIPGQREQLIEEGIAIRDDGTVDFDKSPPLTFESEQTPDPQTPEPAPIVPPPEIKKGNPTILDTFSPLIDQLKLDGFDELLQLFGETEYEKSSFANLISNILEKKLSVFLNQNNTDLFTLLRLAEDNGLLQANAVDLAHLIRKARNQIIHNTVPGNTFHARNCLVISAACLLWPQLPR